MIPANIIEAMEAPECWGRWFVDGDWRAWKTYLRAVFGLPIPASDLPLYRDCTGRAAPPTDRAAEAYGIVGRRGGKTRIAALCVAWLATFEDWRVFLSRGEKAHVLLVSKDRQQAGVAFSYVQSMFLDHPALKKLVRDSTSDTIELRNQAVIRVAAASFRGLRGYAIPAMVADELAFWFDGETSQNPAEEILRAVKPAMLQFGGRALLLGCSSPYRRAGPLWEAYKRHWGQPGETLVWLAPTATMHPLDEAERAHIEREFEKDAEGAAAEYECRWRDDLAAFVEPETIERAVMAGVTELPPVRGVQYYAALDPSGGGADSYALGIAHVDAGGRAILDLVREWKPGPHFSPLAAVNEAASLMHLYGGHEVVTDHWGGEFAREPLWLRGINAIVAEQHKSDIYLELLPALRSGQVALLDDRRLISQASALERKTSATGKDRVDHPRNLHDDVINAAALALVTALRDRAPALMHRRHFLGEDGLPVPMPKTAQVLNVVLIVADDGMAATVFFTFEDMIAPGAPPLVLVDFDVAPLSGGTIDRMYQRLEDLARECRIRSAPFTWVQPEIVQQVHLRGFLTEPIPPEYLMDPRSLALGVSGHVQGGLVKMAATAHAKMAQLPLGASLTFRGSDPVDWDPLRWAMAIGIALALNPSVSVTAPVTAAAMLRLIH